MSITITSNRKSTLASATPPSSARSRKSAIGPVTSTSTFHGTGGAALDGILPTSAFAGQGSAGSDSRPRAASRQLPAGRREPSARAGSEFALAEPQHAFAAAGAASARPSAWSSGTIRLGVTSTALADSLPVAWRPGPLQNSPIVVVRPAGAKPAATPPLAGGAPMSVIARAPLPTPVNLPLPKPALASAPMNASPCPLMPASVCPAVQSVVPTPKQGATKPWIITKEVVPLSQAFPPGVIIEFSDCVPVPVSSLVPSSAPKLVPLAKPAPEPTLKPVASPVVAPVIAPLVKPPESPMVSPMVSPVVKPAVTSTVTPTVTLGAAIALPATSVAAAPKLPEVPESNFRSLRDNDNALKLDSGRTVAFKPGDLKTKASEPGLLIGTDGNDHLDDWGSGLDEGIRRSRPRFTRFAGGGGDDVIIGGASDDTMWGGTGNDTLLGREGDDKLYGEDGDDRLDGDSGNDLLVGGGRQGHSVRWPGQRHPFGG